MNVPRLMNPSRILRSLVIVTWIALAWAWTPLQAQLPSEIQGIVTDARTGHPIQEARVEIVGQTERTLSQRDGAFAFRGLEPRTYTIRVRATGYLPLTTDVSVDNGRVARVDAALAPAPVVVSEMVIHARRDTASATSITFDRAAIEASGRRDVGELLRSTAGVVVTQSGGPGSAETISIRGSNANEVLVLVDGVPINSAITGTADLSQLSLEHVERVTVLPGAQSARYGSRALAGVVTIETRRDISDVSALTRAGAWGERNVALAAGANHPVGSTVVAGAVNADYRTVQGDFDYDIPAVRGGGTAVRSNGDVTSNGLFATGSVDGSAAMLGVRAGWQSTRRGMPGSIVQPSTTGRERDMRATVTVDGQWRTGIVAWRSSADVSHEATYFADPNPPYGTAYDDTVRATGLTLNASGTVPLPGVTSTFGAESRTFDITSSMLVAGTPHVQRQFGSWLDLRSTPVSLGAVLLSANVTTRVDWDTFLSGATTSPRIGLTLGYGLFSLETSLGQGYAPPALGDQFFREGVLVKPNPNLQPERVRHDLDARLTMRDVALGALQFNGAVNTYRSDVDGMILWSPNFQFVWSPNNFDVHRSGWDLMSRVGMPDVGASIDATWSHSHVTYTGVSSGQVTYRPVTTANITTALTRDIGTLDVVTRFVGARRSVESSALNTLDPYWLTDLHVARPIVARAWRLDLAGGIDNLFDRPAAMLVDYPFPGRTWTLSLRVTRGGDRHSGAMLPLTP